MKKTTPSFSPNLNKNIGPTQGSHQIKASDMNFRSWEYAKKEAAPTRATGGTGRRPGNQGLFNRDLQVILSFAGAALLAGVVYLFVKSQGG